MSKSETTKTGWSGKAIARIVVAVLIVLFVFQNTDDTRVTFLFFDMRTGLWLALVLAMLLGAAAGYLMARRGNEKDEGTGKP